MGQPAIADRAVGEPAAAATPPAAGLERLWLETRGNPSVAVAVLDGPVDLSHACFRGARLTVLTDGGDAGTHADLAALHGTHVTSVIFGQHDGPVRGIAPGCSGLIVPVFRTEAGGGVIPCSQLDLARAIVRSVSHGARIVNISGGQLEATGEPEPALADALALCAAEGVLVVTAAGNDGCECLHVPAADPRVLVVGAMDVFGEPLGSSNWSATYASRGLLAPGAAIPGAVPGGGTMALTGTSLATAIVSGTAALLMSLQWQTARRINIGAVRQALLATAIGCDAQPSADCRRLLAGRLSVEGALEYLLQENHVTNARGTSMSDHDLQTSDRMETSPGSRIGAFLENGAAVAETPAASAPEIREAPAPPRKSGCGCGAKTGTLVYALGQIDYDFGTEANRDSFIQQGLDDPGDAHALLAHLEQNPWSAESVLWTLVHETTPIYAVRPAGPFAVHGYDRLREFLRGQLDEGVSQVSLPGVEVGQATLLNGQIVPVLAPDVRGMYSWSTPVLVRAVLGARPRGNAGRVEFEGRAGEISNFLDRIYYELSNLGLSPRDRAINYAATNAWQAAAVYQRAIQDKMKLDTITAERSRICRPGADCWDVLLTFFDPAHRHERARVVHRFTVDVSEVIPVTVGQVRSWEVY